jgi:hypothetical protein
MCRWFRHSPEWVARLPYGKIPDWRDFRMLDHAARQRYWRVAIAEGERLADAFLTAAAREDLAARLQPV